MQLKNLLWKLSIVIIGSFFVLSCSGIIKDKQNNHLPTTVEITMLKFEFVPKTLHIKSGQSVRWVNKEKRQYHSVWFEIQGEEESDYLFPGDTLTKLFNTPGTFPYRCGPHPEMIATIIVE